MDMISTTKAHNISRLFIVLFKELTSE